MTYGDVNMLGAAAFLAAMAAAAASDLCTMRIANTLVAGLVFGFVVLAPFSGLSWQGIGVHALTAGAILAGGFAAFAFGVMGAGDGKLAAATVLWLGPAPLAEYLLVVALAGGVLALAALAFRAAPLPAALHTQIWARRLHRRRAGIPYGIALAIAGALALRGSLWLPAAL